MTLRFALAALSCVSFLASQASASAVIDVTDATFQELVVKPAHDKVYRAVCSRVPAPI